MRPASWRISPKRSGVESASSSWGPRSTRRRPRSPRSSIPQAAAATARLGAERVARRRGAISPSGSRTRIRATSSASRSSTRSTGRGASSSRRSETAVHEGKQPSPVLRALAELGLPAGDHDELRPAVRARSPRAGKEPRVERLHAEARSHARLPRPDAAEPDRLQDPRRHRPARSRSSSPTRTTSSSCCG